MMAETSLARIAQPDTRRIKALVLNGLTSPHSKRAYGLALDDFLGWYEATGRARLDKASVNAYRAHLLDRGLAPSTINGRLSAVRKLAVEASDNGLIAPELAAGVQRARGVKQSGARVGNWLSKSDAQKLLNQPTPNTLKGLRDRAILAVLLGCGLRRTEVASLTFDHIQQRDARWVIVDIVGKGNRVRSVPAPAWAIAAIQAWQRAAGLSDGLVFRRINKGDRIASDRMTAPSIRDVVKTYSLRIGLDDIPPHDLRRTPAKLAHKGGAALDQIQLSLGHASIQTTERYLGVEQDLHNAPCDALGLGL